MKYSKIPFLAAVMICASLSVQAHAQTDYKNSCPAESLPPSQSSCPSPSPAQPPYEPPPSGESWQWNPNDCRWELDPGSPSPIIIDTKNTGFVFTDPKQGQYVTFDMRGDGTYEELSWPKHGSGNAWLVYDRDGDGVIKNGTELFGNFTPHSDGGIPNNKDANGFLALAWYDQPAQGGNMDLLLDKRDAIWQKLRLWIDEHCYLTPDDPCQSRPYELHTLESEGIRSLSLVYGGKIHSDAVGNQYTFYAVVNPEAEDATADQRHQHAEKGIDDRQRSKDGRLMYDVFLKTAQ